MASSSDDEEANSWERFESLCRDLNMDEETSQEAWSSYQKISTNYTLEVSLPLFECLRSLHVCFEYIVIPYNRSPVRGFHRFRIAIRSFRQKYFLQQTIFFSGRLSTLAGMCFIRRLPQERCSDR